AAGGGVKGAGGVRPPDGGGVSDGSGKTIGGGVVRGGPGGGGAGGRGAACVCRGAGAAAAPFETVLCAPATVDIETRHAISASRMVRTPGFLHCTRAQALCTKNLRDLVDLA